MPDIVLFSVPTDGTNDVRLRDPTAIAGAVEGTLAAVETQDTAVFAGVLEYSGALAAVEAQDVAAFDGTIAAPAVTGDLAATEAQDVASFDGSVAGGTQSLTGRRIRGRRVVYPDELPPIGLEADAPVEKIELPSLETAQAALIEAKAALETAITAKAEVKRAKQLAMLETALGQAQAHYDAAQEAENAIIQRLRDEDEFWLLAA